MSDMKLKLGDVEETALIPLAIRANETKRKMARIQDKKAVEIIDILGIDTKAFDKFGSHEGVVARTIVIDKAVKHLLEQYPDAVCLNLGCGLDDRFSRVDNGKITWYNMDLPDSIAVRRKVYKESDREHMLAGDVLSTEWTNKIDKRDIAIVIAEGLFMYFSKEQVKTILNNITSSFGEGFLVVELMHPKMMKENVHDTVKNTNAHFGWGTENGTELLPLDEKMSLVKESSLSDEMKKGAFLSKMFAIIISKLNNRIAVYRWQ